MKIRTLFIIMLFSLSVAGIAQPFEIFKSGSLQGVKQSGGNTVVEPLYDSIKILSPTHGFLVQTKGKTGFVNTKGKMLVNPSETTDLYSCRNSDLHVIYFQNKNYWLLNVQTAEVFLLDDYDAEIKADGSESLLTEDDFLRFRSNKLTGLMQFPQKKILDAKYTDIYPLPEKPNYFLLKEGKFYRFFQARNGNTTELFEAVNDYSTFRFDNSCAYIQHDELIPAKFAGIWYLLNPNGTKYEMPKFETVGLSLDNFESTPLLTKQNGKFGYMDLKGNVVIECKYDDASWFYENSAVVKFNGKYGVIRDDQSVKVPFVFDFMADYKEYFTKATLGNYVFGIGLDGESEIAKGKTGIYYCKNDERYAVLRKGKVFSIINVQTKVEYDIPEYEDMLELDDYFCNLKPGKKMRFSTGGKLGILLFPDQIVLKPEYDKVNFVMVNDSLALTVQGNVYRFFNLFTKQFGVGFETDAKFNPFYYDDDLVSFACDYPVVPAKINGAWHLIQLSGKATSLEKFEPILPKFIERMNEPLLSKQNGKFGYTDIFGNELIPFIYTDAEWFSEQLGKVSVNGKYGFINPDNTVAVPLIYEQVQISPKTFEISAVRDGKTFVLDNLGKLTDSVIANSNSAGKVGFTVNGKQFIDCKFDFVTDFVQGIALVNLGGTQQPDGSMQGGKWGAISYAGDYVIEPNYNELAFFASGLLRAKNNQAWGLINLQNEIVLPFEYEDISSVGDTFAKAKKDGKEYRINKFGISSN